MRTRLVLAAGVLAAATASTLPAFAAPGDHGSGVGGCIDSLYGNATNPRDGGNGIIPSISPGPWVASTGDFGLTVGDINQGLQTYTEYNSTAQWCQDGNVFP